MLAGAVVIWLLVQTTWRERLGVAALLAIATLVYAVRRARTPEPLPRLQG